MEATRTLLITLPAADAPFLRRQSRNMGWQVTTVRPKRNAQPKVEMTEDEFRAKLAHSKAQAEAGNVVTMRQDETAEQFLDRICM